jgi:hAT family C-terminal dimerisation region
MVINPIQYWYGIRQRWPRLARMAIDLFGIPAMSSEPERLFSDTGDMVTLKRNRLHADIIGAGMCLKQWDRDGAIDWR